MQPAVSTLIALALIAALTFGCDGGGDDDLTPTATPVSASSSPAPDPTATPRAPIQTTPATLEGCPIDDGALCRFAIDLQDGLNASDLEVIASRLAPEARPCQGTFAPIGEDIDCESEQDTSDPVVLLIGFSSDCCHFRPERFVEELSDWVNETSDGAAWRLYGVIPDAVLYDAATSIVLTRGTGPEAPVLMVAVSGDSAAIPWIAKGPFELMYLRPEETLLPWP